MQDLLNMLIRNQSIFISNYLQKIHLCLLIIQIFLQIKFIIIMQNTRPSKEQTQKQPISINKNIFSIKTKTTSASPEKNLRNSLRKQFIIDTSRPFQPIKLFPSTIGQIGAEKMQKSFKIIKQLKNTHSSNIGNNLTQKLERIKNKCMKNRNSGLSIDKNSLYSKQDQEQQINQSQDIDNDDQTLNAKAYLQKSKYSNRPATIFFNYPKCCAIENVMTNRIIPIEGRCDLKYKLTGQQYKCIMNSLQFNGFTRTQGNEWNILFDINGTQLKSLVNMNKYQKMNHFPGCWTLGRKDYMWKALNKLKRKFPDQYNFVPITYLFPNDFQRFQMIRQNESKQHLWIMKPSNSACGRGIKMVTKQSKIKNRKDYLVSQYISNPHLINELKYDLRIYIFVSSYDPLRIYMFDQGLTRFATHKYTTNIKQVKKRFVHLTNFSVNKHSKNFVKNQQTKLDGKGSKWSLTALKAYYQSLGIDTTELFNKIKDIIIKTCIAAEPTMLDINSKSQQRRNCGFQLYGFDILIDSNLKPWLMEVNVCPSLSSSSPMDRRIKHTLLTDILNLIGLQYFEKKKYNQQKKKQKQKSLLVKNEKRAFSKNINNLQQLNYKNCIELLSPQDWLILFETEEQFQRKGHFQRIFPNKNNIDNYLPFFQFPRYNNVMVSKWLKNQKNFLDLLYR